MADRTGEDLRDRCVGALRSAGAVAVGVCGTGPLTEARAVIEQRLADGLSGGMAFTYRNPVRSTDPRSALPSARSAVVAALPYGSHRMPPPSGDGTSPLAEVARYAAHDTYRVLRDALGAAARLLQDEGHRAVVVADDNALVDRAIAHRAGLGWFGRNTNLLVAGVGSWVVLGTVLTDAELVPTADAPVPDRCGTCRRCMDSCPTGAFVGPGVMDASRCLSWLLQREGEFPRDLRPALGRRIYGCDECQVVCPPNRRAPEVRHPVTGPGDQLELRWLLTAPDAELLSALGAWYIPRRDVRYVRRNALVVLGNTPGVSDVLLRELLEAFLRSEDPMLVSHAAWAARRHRLEDLLAVAEVAEHPEVRAELCHPRPPTVDVRQVVPAGDN